MEIFNPLNTTYGKRALLKAQQSRSRSHDKLRHEMAFNLKLKVIESSDLAKIFLEARVTMDAFFIPESQRSRPQSQLVAARMCVLSCYQDL